MQNGTLTSSVFYFNNIIKNYPAGVTHETLETRDYLFFKINFVFPFLSLFLSLVFKYKKI